MAQPKHKAPQVHPMALMNAQNFDAELFKYVAANDCSQKEAFEVLNEIYTTACNRPRYASFESYKVSRHKRLHR